MFYFLTFSSLFTPDPSERRQARRQVVQRVQRVQKGGLYATCLRSPGRALQLSRRNSKMRSATFKNVPAELAPPWGSRILRLHNGERRTDISLWRSLRSATFFSFSFSILLFHPFSFLSLFLFSHPPPTAEPVMMIDWPGARRYLIRQRPRKEGPSPSLLYIPPMSCLCVADLSAVFVVSQVLPPLL